MTREELDLFASRFDGFAALSAVKQIDYLAYYLLAQKGKESITAGDLEECFKLLDLRPYARMSVHLSESASKKDGRFIKHSKGYRLERAALEEIRAIVDAEPEREKVSVHLTDLVPKISEAQERVFLEEAIRSFRVKAFRAAVVMTWILTMEHLQRFTYGNKLSEFNAAIAAHPDNKRMKAITAYDDFADLKESRVIELMRSAGVISPDVRRILDEKLGIRNSAGHPSGVILSPHKATEFILDLVENVILKY